MTSTAAVPKGPLEIKDEYTLDPADVVEPPRGWRASMRYFGPGLLLSAAIVGSGELIATTALGAEAGFAILWMVVISTFVKVAVQMEFARWTISTGQPAMTGLNKVPPLIGGRWSWTNILWGVVFIGKQMQYGGIVGGVVLALSMLWPIVGDPMGFPSLVIWTAVLTAVTIAVLYKNNYARIESIGTLMVAGFTIFTVAVAFGLLWTPFAYTVSDVASGFSFLIPAGAIGAAVAMFGISGVGSDEILIYNYWCLEKGYARFAGPNDGSEAWVDRANGWIKVMYKDAAVSWVVYTFATVAFFTMGAAVLHPQGLVPAGNEMLVTLSSMYTDAVGEWSGTVFLIGAILVLGSTYYATIPSYARLFTNYMANFGLVDWNNRKQRLTWLKVLTVIYPIVWGLEFLFMQNPVWMVQIGGIASGIFLLVVVTAVIFLRKTETDPRVRGGKLFNVLLTISVVAIGLVAIYSTATALGFKIG